MTSPRYFHRPLFWIVALTCSASPLVVESGEPQIISAAHGLVDFTVLANGNSVAPRVSPDGRFILFSSSANNLVTNDNGYFGLDAFLHDRSSNATVLVSESYTGTGGGNGNTVGLQVSTNGRYVLLRSDASDLVPSDTNEANDIFVRDLQLGTNMLVSVAADGGLANGDSTEAVMTSDGRWVAFVSEASNLVPDDTNGIPDLFLRDVVDGTTEVVSRGAKGLAEVVSSPVITPDGRYVAFFSTAKEMVAEVPAGTRGEIYLYDAVTEQLTWVSTNAAATAQSLLNFVNMPSIHPAISDDGRYVAFKTGWTNGTATFPSTPANATIIFQYDSVSGASTVVSTNAFPPWIGSDDVYGPEMTLNGRFVAYVEREATGTTNHSSVRVWDRNSGTRTIVSVGPFGLFPTNTITHTPALSDDGRYLVFLSNATNLVSNSVSNGFHIYYRDLDLQRPAILMTNVLVDTNPVGIGSDDQFGVVPAMSADGSTVVFSTLDGSLVDSDDNKSSDVFLWDATSETTELISIRDPNVISLSGNRASSLGQASFNGSGSVVAFASYASDLVTNDFNRECDVFVRDLARNTSILVSAGMDGNSGLGGGSYDPVISSDGRFVVFVSTATNLVPGDTDNSSDIFRRDLVTGATTIVSANTNGNHLGVGDCSYPLVSHDARYVVFLASFGSALYWRDLGTGTTHLLSSTDSDHHVSMSSDGSRVAYFDNFSRLFVWDADLMRNSYSNLTFQLTWASLSPNGERLLFLRSGQLYQRDLASLGDSLLDAGPLEIKAPVEWSGDGRYVAFVTASSLVAMDNNGVNDVYLRDFQAGGWTLVSVNHTVSASAAGASDSPVLSADGRFLLYRSTAADVAPGIITPPSLVLYDRLAGTNTLLVAGTPEGAWPARVSKPAVSASGQQIAFQGWDDGLAADDLNQAGDAYAATITEAPAPDSDGDGTADWWMNLYFGHATGQAEDSSRADDDADDDKVTNRDEFSAGTNPRSPISTAASRIAVEKAEGGIRLHWETLPGRNHQLLSTTNLTHLLWETFPGSPLINGYHGTLNLQNTEALQFFRIESED